MKRLYYSGVVHPERALLTLRERCMTLSAEKAVAKLVVRIQLNQITVAADVDEEMDPLTLRNLVRMAVQTLVAVAGFLHGHLYEVEITKVFSEDLETSTVFGVDVGILANRYKHLNLNEAYDRLLYLTGGKEGIYLQRCFEDLQAAMRSPNDTPFHCYRALESLKQFVRDAQGIDREDDSAQWQALRKLLRADKSDIEHFRTLAFEARHGVPIPINDAKRAACFETTFNLVERFINYLLGQRKQIFQLGPPPPSPVERLHSSTDSAASQPASK